MSSLYEIPKADRERAVLSCCPDNEEDAITVGVVTGRFCEATGLDVTRSQVEHLLNRLERQGIIKSSRRIKGKHIGHARTASRRVKVVWVEDTRPQELRDAFMPVQKSGAVVHKVKRYMGLAPYDLPDNTYKGDQTYLESLYKTHPRKLIDEIFEELKSGELV